MNRGKQLIIASAILALLILITLQMRRDPFDPPGRPDYSKLLPARAEGSIDKVVIKNKESGLTLEKRGDNWWITSPRELAVEESTAKVSVGFLERVAIAEVASRKKERQAEYGFADSPETVEVQVFSKNQELFGFKAGKTTADFSGSFVILGSDPGTVYTTTQAMPPQFGRGFGEWRVKTILNLNKDELERIQLVNTSGTLELIKDSQGNWSRKDDPQWKLDINRLSQLTGSFSKLGWAKVVDDPDPAEDYGFSKPQGKLTLTVKGKDYTLILGNEVDKAEGNTWIRLDGDPRVYQIRKSAAERIARNWDYYGEEKPSAKPEEKPAAKPEAKPEAPAKAGTEPPKSDPKSKEDKKTATPPQKGKK